MTSVRKWKTALLVLAGLALALASIHLTWQSAKAPSQRAQRARGFGFAPGQTYEYTLRYDTLHHAAEGIGSQAGLGGALQLEGTYALSVHAVHGGRTLFSVALGELRHAKLQMADQFLWRTPADAAPVFAGRRLFFEADATGKVHAIVESEAADADSPEARLFAHTMETLVTELSLSLAGNGREAWDAQERTTYGTASSHYRSEGSVDGAQTFRRTRDRASSLRVAALSSGGVQHTLEADHRFALAGDRTLLRLDGSEALHVESETKPLQSVSTRLSLVFLRVRPEPALAAQVMGKRRALQDQRLGAESERDHLLQRVDGLDFATLSAGLVALGGGAERSDLARFLWRASGLLTLEPQRCAELVPLVTRSDAPGKLRALALDLLAAVPDARATAAMLAILESPDVQGDADYLQLVQRLGFQQVPTPEAVAFLEARHEAAARQHDDDALYASAYSLGAMAQELAPGSPEAERIVGRLRAATERAQTSEGLSHHVRALGNVGNETVLADVRRHLHHDTAEVRKAVATALGSVPSPEAQRDLVALVADPAPEVQRQAIQSLQRQQADATVLGALEHSLTQGLAADNVPYLLDLLKRLRGSDPAGVARVVDALVASGVLSAQQKDLALLLKAG
jgi:HEAT repeat protein